ncbi:4-hydroxy-tetrahydrodipicolinate synthase [Zhouia sp. PK063]|uniref:4-hydroxy-tetrahydrodipicolinate synthase n=1 Tax=Zhouia sp. PK063 TaxID=3373602 RepID=UPI0037BB3306
MSRFIGTGVALITPFKSDLSVDVEALERLVNFVIDGGVNYLVVLGTTAESATLTKQEKQLVKQVIKNAANGRVPLVLGVGGNNTYEIAEELKTTDLSGFEAILSVSPAYNKPTQEGIYQHFKVVAEASPLPIILYNVPGRTGSNMLPSTVVRLAKDFTNIIGIKEAAGDIVQAMRLIQQTPEGFLVISGDDMLTFPMIQLGGAGVISVIGQGIPREFSNMVTAALNNETEVARKLHFDVMNSIDYIFEEGNPAGIKALLSILNVCSASVRLPLVPASEVLTQKLSNFLATVTA